MTEDKNKKYLDFDKVDHIKILDMNEDVNIKVDSECFELLKQIELENWKQNQVYDEIPCSQQKKISPKLVCSICSWLVAKGFEEINHEIIPKDSPICSKEVL